MRIRAALLTVPTVVVALVAGLAAPASATTPYDVHMVHGQLAFSTGGAWKVPSAGGCTSDVRLSGTIDPTDPTDNMTGTLDAKIFLPALPPLLPADAYVFLATGSGTGTNAGVFDPGTGSFAGLQIAGVSFTVKNVTGCTPTTTVNCSGTLSTLTFGGGLYDGSTFPLTNPESFYVNATGTVATRWTCNFPSSPFITLGATVSVADNPDTDHPPIGFTDPGAIFVQA